MAHAIAFFDLDKTLLSVNSATLWVRRERGLGHVTLRQAARAAIWLAGYHMGVTGHETALAEAVAQLTGQRAEPIQRRTKEFFEQTVRHRFRPGAAEVLARHRAASDRCVLLTSSSSYMAEEVVKALKLDGALCNTLEVDGDGRLTGRIVGKVCFGLGKLSYAEDEANRHRVQLRDCSFYTDSHSDVPVLERVGHPVAVCPDPRLRRLALRRGWPISDWGS